MPNSAFGLAQIRSKKVKRKICFYLLLLVSVSNSQPEKSPEKGRLPSVPFRKWPKMKKTNKQTNKTKQFTMNLQWSPCHCHFIVAPFQGDSVEIELTIEFCSNFPCWLLILREIKCWNKKGVFWDSFRSRRTLKIPCSSLIISFQKRLYSSLNLTQFFKAKIYREKAN